MVRYAKPKSLDEALSLLSAGRWKLLAGGTDFYPAQGVRPFRNDILDINGLTELRGIRNDGGDTVFGALSTWSDIMMASLPPAFDALKQAAREVGSVQIQNVGTIAGNLCNASPAADGVPPLMALDAAVEIRSGNGLRTLSLQEFVLGNRKTALRLDEIVTAIRVPEQAVAGRSLFQKLGGRRYLVISIAMVAARIEVEQGRVARAAIAVGACSAVAQRLTELEQDLVGADMRCGLGAVAQARHFLGLTPIDDVRASAGYRRRAAREIMSRTLDALVTQTASVSEPA